MSYCAAKPRAIIHRAPPGRRRARTSRQGQQRRSRARARRRREVLDLGDDAERTPPSSSTARRELEDVVLVLAGVGISSAGPRARAARSVAVELDHEAATGGPRGADDLGRRRVDEQVHLRERRRTRRPPSRRRAVYPVRLATGRPSQSSSLPISRTTRRRERAALARTIVVQRAGSLPAPSPCRASPRYSSSIVAVSLHLLDSARRRDVDQLLRQPRITSPLRGSDARDLDSFETRGGLRPFL